MGDLTPVVSLQQRRFLFQGLPFTHCHSIRNVSDEYIIFCIKIPLTYLNNLSFKTSHHFYYKNKYTQASCAMDGLVRKIREQCGCIPHYFPQEKYRSRFQHSFKHIVEFNLYLCLVCKNKPHKEIVRYQSMLNVLPRWLMHSKGVRINARRLVIVDFTNNKQLCTAG